MGSGSSKRRLKEQEEENKKLRGRLHEIPQKNEELKRLKQELDRARKRLANSALAELERENSDLKNTNHELLEELQQAKSEADMYRSVSDLSRTSRTTRTSTAGSYGRISLTEMRQSEKKRQARMQGISAEPGKYKDADVMNRDLEKFPKDQRVKELIREAINENDFLQHLQEDQITEIIDCMQPTTVQPGVSIIKEGEDGDKLYVIESGEAKVTKRKRGEDEFLRTMREKTLFGELAILYSTPRTASCTAITKCNLWNLERVTFQIIMMKTGLLKSQDRLEMIKRIPRFRNNSEELLTQIIDAFDENQYELDEYIVRQGAKGETFYIIVSGKILARKTHSNGKEERRYLKKGDWFGEKALDGEEVRQESMMVTSPEGVTCLCMDRDTLKAIMEKNVKIASGSAARRRSTHLTATVRDIPDNLKRTRLGDLCIIETLGVGGFGRVELVQVGEESSQTYALKQIKKCHVVEMKQQDHILNERRILLECKSEFIIRLYRTYRNNKFVYMLMDASLGGELWRHLRDRGPFNDTATRFYTACTMEALDYLHARGIVYRDLKPENLLMSANGYVKLVDFGFAKKIGHGKKTWTFCGTPEYVAPEIILNKGHDFAVDLWSLGILMYELLTGNPPFSASDPMKTYNMILKGVDAINIPRRVSKNAKDLIKKLCREQASERLGYSRAGIVEVQKHKWFDGFNWEGLRSRKVEPPSKPTIRNATDTGNFDEYPEENDPVPEETSDWDREFAEQF